MISFGRETTRPLVSRSRRSKPLASTTAVMDTFRRVWGCVTLLFACVSRRLFANIDLPRHPSQKWPRCFRKADLYLNGRGNHCRNPILVINHSREPNDLLNAVTTPSCCPLDTILTCPLTCQHVCASPSPPCCWGFKLGAEQGIFQVRTPI